MLSGVRLNWGSPGWRGETSGCCSDEEVWKVAMLGGAWLPKAPTGPGELEEEILDPDSNLEDMPDESNLEEMPPPPGSNFSNCCKEALPPTGLPSWHQSCRISSRRFFISALYSDTRNFLPEKKNGDENDDENKKGDTEDVEDKYEDGNLGTYFILKGMPNSEHNQMFFLKKMRLSHWDWETLTINNASSLWPRSIPGGIKMITVSIVKFNKNDYVENYNIENMGVSWE